MKSCGILCALVLASLVLCPVAAIKPAKAEPAALAVNAAEGEAINVFSSSTGKVEKVDMHEYLIGSLAAEMPPSYHTQALKAQAVACYTYAVRTRNEQRSNPDLSLAGADISDSSKMHQGYISKQQRKELWGDKFEENEAKLESAVYEVYGNIITYEGEAILALYHSICAGRTQSAESMWGSDIAYLQSVESPGDLLSPDYKKTVVFDEAEFKKLLSESGVKLEGDAEDWLGKTKTDDSGYVLSVSLCGTEYGAGKLREALGIRSTCFTVEHGKSGFTVETLGYGHAVGMSQYGADYMARQGSTWREILLHYYSNAKIEAQTAGASA